MAKDERGGGGAAPRHSQQDGQRDGGCRNHHGVEQAARESGPANQGDGDEGEDEEARLLGERRGGGERHQDQEIGFDEFEKNHSQQEHRERVDQDLVVEHHAHGRRHREGQGREGGRCAREAEPSEPGSDHEYGAREQEQIEPEEPHGRRGGGEEMDHPGLEDAVTPGRQSEDARAFGHGVVDVPVEGGQNEAIVLRADPQAEDQDPDGGAQGQQGSLEHPTVGAGSSSGAGGEGPTSPPCPGSPTTDTPASP